MKILVIEDDPIMRKSLKRGLTEGGHSCEAYAGGKDGLAAADADPPDLVLLDVMLPDLSGVDVLKALRSSGARMPVIMLTARGAVDDRVAGLSAGADDYMVKPFAFSELLARIEAVCRRTFLRPASVLKVGAITLDLSTRRVQKESRSIDLTPTEFSILEQLMRFAGQVVTRKMLCQHVWGFTWDGNTNVIEVHITRLRHKLDGGSEASCIHTVRGRGYAIRAS